MKGKLLLLFLLFTSLAMAQRTVTGKLTDAAEGSPLIGATVVVKGTTAGTITDVDGKYSINVPKDGRVLVFSYVGYLSQEVEIGNQSEVSVKLAVDTKVLEDVVVVGYGTQQKRSITGTISSIKGEDLTAQSVQSFDQALQGRAAGVNVSIPNGVLNNPPVFRIRGINSINLSSFPLIVIDGVPTYSGDFSQNSAANNVLSNLNPNDIESLDILKDASAAAIYGSRAAAGVVLITTKRGKKGQTRVNYDGWASWTQPARLPEVLNAQQFVTIKNEARRNAGLADAFFLDSLNGKLVDTKWSDYIYRNGFSHNHNLSFSGGSDNTTYFLALGYTEQEGMIRNNDFNRKTARLNLDHKIGSRVKIGGAVSYAGNYNRAPNTGALNGQAFNSSGLARIAFNLAPIVPARLADGSYNINTSNQTGQGKNLVGLQWQNPLPLIDLNKITSEATQIQGSVYGQVDIIKGLYFRTQYGIDNIGVENITFYTPVHGDGFPSGSATNSTFRNTRWNWQNLLNYDVNLGKSIGVNVLVGNEQQYTSSNGWGANRTGIADPFFTTFQGNFTTIVPSGNFQGENYLLSYFGRVNFDFNKLFLVTLNARQDEYSAYAPGKKKGTFWGGSAGLTISELDFWKNTVGSAVSYLRLRGSYGQVGNSSIGDYASLGLYSSGLYAADPTFFFSQAGNPNLTWETSTKTDIGVNFGLLNDRITGEITYFKNLIGGLILPVPSAPSQGIPGNSISTNIGSMQNTGWEFGLNGTIVNTPKFRWNSNINFTLMENEVTQLDQNNTDIFFFTSGLEQTNIIRWKESIGSIYAVESAGVNPANGQRMYYNRAGRKVQYNHAATGSARWTYVDDGSVAPAITVAADGKLFGPTLPKWFGAWDNTFSAYGFDLNVQVQYSGGNYIYNGSRAGLRDQRVWNNEVGVLNRWQKPGDITDMPKVVWADNVSNGSALPNSANIEKGDFLRVRNITLGYTLPGSFTNRAGINRLRIYANVNNAFLFTNYTGTDPEVSTNGNTNGAPGVDRNTAPMARTFLVGINLGF